MSAIVVRRGTSADCPAIAQLLEALQIHDEHSKVMNDVAQLRQDGFGRAPWFHSFVAEDREDPENPAVVGLALFYYCYSMLSGRMAHLEALYVNETHRGQGLGTQLWKEVAKAALQENCVCMQIETVGGNDKAINTYMSKGCINLTDSKAIQVLLLNEPELTEFANS